MHLMHHFAKSVHKSDYGIVATLCSWQLDNEIHADRLDRLLSGLGYLEMA